ncbi:hypothetical protein M1M27_gp40 [Cellulophaga phage Ingeline_1]|uniref:Uncharacterized protein n=1 Tax=Cellulophaga phage Ingeline_1 TaxID=2745674 RepID=A0A8E4ZEP9_9CAUD|nr:hypothetical protein M1M27_gp40 [Cellulophaga phage Ingeline_1]QQV89997.1 hypothetical protein Ingeline2_11 [Cellulophaga phage Ingeline_2]QQV90047.1 hypothetical protein Ingeline3_11 [Cellulophaga phage Ingeline_3]QQV90097.1 hypothetical protein Ingeline4_11 [Cellulophaga phage Ingeline_4]QQV90147.1 hypothetical protein Ingeline5_11 [Cellulophaga phage Ingeline_5]QQV90196.1 hypothetical protein Ingeline6_11 [Cellulophaga phage Ingeline_6]QQV90246.1 hypothetical protein Ingeline7_11 [Cellu
MQSLQQLIEEEDVIFVEKIMDSNCVASLKKMKIGATINQCIIIDARIDNINFLVA